MLLFYFSGTTFVCVYEKKRDDVRVLKDEPDIKELSAEKRPPTVRYIPLPDLAIPSRSLYAQLITPPAVKRLQRLMGPGFQLQAEYYSIKGGAVNFFELLQQNIQNCMVRDNGKYHIIATETQQCLSTTSGVVGFWTKGRRLNTQSEEFDLELVAEKLYCDNRVVRIKTVHSSKENPLVRIKRELKRKKKAPNPIGNMTSSVTLILVYGAQELFVKLFYNGKFQVNGNCHYDEVYVEAAIRYIRSRVHEASRKIYPDLELESKIVSSQINMINYKHRYMFSQPRMCFSIEKLSKILKHKYQQRTLAECRTQLQSGRLPVYFVRYNMDKAMLYVKYLTPRHENMSKVTCVVLSMSGKINIQGCNDDLNQLRYIYHDVYSILQRHSDQIVVKRKF